MDLPKTADVVICGAGIAGVSAAYHLAVRHGVCHVVLVDERPPLSLTSDKSTECYRNWWPGPGDAMVRLMNRSIDLLEAWAHETGNRINLNRRGYVFATADPARIEDFRQAAEEAARLGAGPARYHTGAPDDPPYQPAPPEGFEDQPTGTDLITDPDLIREHFPYLAEHTVAVLHPRRAGWFSGQQLGAYLLEQARACGARLVRGRVEDVLVENGRVAGVKVGADGVTHTVQTRAFVIAAGPMLKEVAGMLGVEAPVYCELHAKVSFNDHLGLFPRHAGLLIWTDPVRLRWTEEERAALEEDEETRWLLGELPAGVHGRPEGPADSPVVLLLWTYHTEPVDPVFPIKFKDPFYPEIVLRGMARMIPALSAYFNRLPRMFVDGGYYTKTRENRPLIGPLPVEGAYVLGALSGYGLMASPAGGELLASYVVGEQVPEFARWFRLERYQDPEYQRLLENWGSTGQL